MDLNLLKNYAIFENEILLNISKVSHQGFSNKTYMLSSDSRKYVIKSYAKDMNVELEFFIQQIAYQQNIASKPLLIDKNNRIFISEFIKGKHKDKLRYTKLKNLAKTLRKLHKTKIKRSSSPLHVTKQNLSSLNKYKRELVLCHNDLNPQNIIFNKDIKFIDWEYSSINDRYFDLSCIIIEFNLNQKEEKYFLKSYFKNNKEINIKKLHDFKIFYKKICILWFKKRQFNKESLRYLKNYKTIK